MEQKSGSLWDCGSTLYDSFELRSFKRQLDAAIAARCLSMPRLSEPEPACLPPIVQIAAPKKQSKQSKLSRSLHKLLRSVFRLKPAPAGGRYMDHRLYGVHPPSGGLTTIPEACEKCLDSPELDSAVRRAASERFTSATGGILRAPTS